MRKQNITVNDAITQTHLGYAKMLSVLCGESVERLIPLVESVAAQVGEPTWKPDEDLFPSDTFFQAGVPLRGNELLSQGSPVWHRTPELMPLVGRLVKRFDLETSYDILTSEDLDHIEKRDQILRKLIQHDHFRTLDELADRAQAFLHFLERNRDSLLETGYSRELFVTWPAPLGVNLYPVRCPQNLFAHVFARHTLSLEGSFIAERSALLWCRPLAPGDESVDDSVPTSNTGGCRTGTIQCCYRDATLMINPDDASRLGESRAALLELKVCLIRRIQQALQQETPLGLWDDCLRIMTEALLGSEADFYLEIDHRWGLELKQTGGSSFGKRGEMMPGGLTELLELIGYCEKELTIGTMHKAKRALETVVNPTEPNPYLAALQSRQRTKIDAALNRFQLHINDEEGFWQEFKHRVNTALRDEFSEDVLVRTRVKRVHAAKFQPYLASFAEMSRISLEQTGGLPHSHLSAAAEASRNRFQLVGKTWSLAFDGLEVHLRDSKGLQHIAYLLKRPYREIPAVEMARAAAGSAIPQSKLGHRSPQVVLDEIGSSLGKSGDLGQMVDDDARQQTWTRIQEMYDEIDDAEAMDNGELAEKLRGEQDELLRYISAGFGLHGRPRKVGSDEERARTTVTRAIDRALDEISGVHPTLGAHLQLISTGRFCSYEPAGGQAPEWEF